MVFSLDSPPRKIQSIDAEWSGVSFVEPLGAKGKEG